MTPGAGKTIMAGLLIKELKIHGLIRRILIVAPANLTFQWHLRRVEEPLVSFPASTLTEMHPFALTGRAPPSAQWMTAGVTVQAPSPTSDRRDGGSGADGGWAEDAGS